MKDITFFSKDKLGKILQLAMNSLDDDIFDI
jgi:hypothetical protein